MSDWVIVGQRSQFAPGTATRVQVADAAVAVVNTEQGELFAVSDTCTHAEVSLSEGEVEDCAIECWLHGSRFDLRSGEPSGPPATVALTTYEVAMSDDADPVISLRLHA